MGNEYYLRMENVRPRDVESYEKNYEISVVENSGGISIFAARGTRHKPYQR
jgi:hypothetical protein